MNKRIKTGFTKFDSFAQGGLRASDLIVVAGRFPMVNTAFALGITEHLVLRENSAVGIFSLSMRKEELLQGFLSLVSCIDIEKIKERTIDLSERHRFTMIEEKISKAPIYIDDTPDISVLELSRRAHQLKKNYNTQLIIVLDYLQLMRSKGQANSPQEEISRSLKVLAGELNIPLVIVNHLHRAEEISSSHRPTFSDLREHGINELDADLVIFLEEHYNSISDNEEIAEIIVAKNRTGPVGSLKFRFLKKCLRLESM